MTLTRLHPRRVRRLTPTAVDGWLFAGSAVFAFVLWRVSNLSAHRDWGRDSIAGYVLMALAAFVLSVVRPRRELLARAILTAVALVVVAIVPMALMIAARAQGNPEYHVLPEVSVIERAGQLVVHGRDPYVADVVDGHLRGAVRGEPRYEAFFPYFPAMTAFGVPSAFHGLGALGDGRVWMAAFTFGLLLVGLWLARAPPDRALRAVQVMCVLPTGAIFIAGGGDDLPVLAISLVSVAAVAHRRVLTSSAAFGLAMAMKLTAWPLAALSLFIVRDSEGRRATRRMAAIMAGIVAVFVVPFAVWDPRTFLANTIEFPLGLSGVNSPAASPLPGHIIVTLVPSAHRVLLVGLFVVGAPLLAWWLWRRPPRDVAAVCRVAAVVTIVVMCVAPATRVGYIVYPVNLLVWSWLFTHPPSEADPPRAPADTPAMGVDRS